MWRCSHGVNDRIDVLGFKFRRSKEVNKSGAQKRRAVVDEVRLLTPAGQVEIMASTVIGERNSMKIELRHQEASHSGEDKRSSTQRQEALSKTGGHQQAKPNRSPPHGLQFLKQVQVGVRVPRNVFFHQRHANVEPTNAVGIVPRLNNAHQTVVHHQ